MKITYRLPIVLVCAWAGLPLLDIPLHPPLHLQMWPQASLDVAIGVARALFLVIAVGAYLGRAWTKHVAKALVIAWTLLVALLVMVAPYGIYGIAMMLHAMSVKGNEVIAGDVTDMMAPPLALLAWAWLVVIMSWGLKQARVGSSTVARDLSSRDAHESRLIEVVSVLILAWVLASPFVVDHERPLRQLSYGVWTSDAAHVKYVLTDAQRGAISADALHVVDDINDDLAHIATGQPTAHSDARHYGNTTAYKSTASRSYGLTAFTHEGKLARIDVEIDPNELSTQIANRKFLLR